MLSPMMAGSFNSAWEERARLRRRVGRRRRCMVGRE
jgi:hypothetical protein